MVEVKSETAAMMSKQSTSTILENTEILNINLEGLSIREKRLYEQMFGCDRKKIEDCKSKLLEIKDVDSVLTQKMPFAIDLNKTFQSIRFIAQDLPALNLQLYVDLSFLNHHYEWFVKYKKSEIYKNDSKAAHELEEIILMAISKVKEVMQELGVNAYYNKN